MALSTQEKELLRIALEKGFFSGVVNTPQGYQQAPITAAILKSVDEKSDDELRSSLIVFQAQYKLNQAANISKQQEAHAKNAQRIAALQAEYDFVSGVTVGAGQ